MEEITSQNIFNEVISSENVNIDNFFEIESSLANNQDAREKCFQIFIQEKR